MAGIRLLNVFTFILSVTPWSVRCNEDCYELSPPYYGVLVYNGSLVGGGQSQPTWRENDTVTFLCDRGYELVDEADRALGTEEWSITCWSSDDASGSGTGGSAAAGSTAGKYTAWSEDPQQFTCSRVNCGQPPSVSNGSFSFNTTDLFSTSLYACDPGYQLSDGRDYSVCWWDGGWRPNTVSCIPITDCGEPPTITNGDRTWTTGRQATVGTIVTYTCDSGYERDGAMEIACTASGQWTQTPTCTTTAALSSTEIYILEGAGAAFVIVLLVMMLCCACCYFCRGRIKQRRYVEDEEALANSGAFTLSNPLVAVKDEDAAGNPLYLTPDELNEFEQQQ